MNRLWVLGAADPEMAAIEEMLADYGEQIAYAVGPDGQRVHPGNAYHAQWPGREADGATVYAVECGFVADESSAANIKSIVTIDHHRPGDPGYGRPPAEFLTASSIGQVIAALGQVSDYPSHWARVAVTRHPHWCGAISRHGDHWVVRTTSVDRDPDADDDRSATAVIIPDDVVLDAAADHCLGAAYRGMCPGVEPDDLMEWRVASRAAYQGRSAADILADIDRARIALRAADHVALSPGFDRHDICLACRYMSLTHNYCECPRAADMRGQHVPELPEAAARDGICFIADVLPGRDGRTKIVCQVGTPDEITAFMRQWAPHNGLIDIYGDPARGFAGGYIRKA